jgi:hypothetical protein
VVEIDGELRRPRYLVGPDAPAVEPLKSLHLTAVPEGSAVVWRLRCDQELKAGWLEPLADGVEPLEFAIDPADAHRATLRVPDIKALVGKPKDAEDRERKSAWATAYRLRWVEKSFGFEFSDPTRYTLEVVPDRAPEVTLLRPRLLTGQDRLVSPVSRRLDLVIDASDDHGLGQVAVVYRLNDGDEARKELATFPPGKRSANNKGAPLTWVLRESLPELKVGDELAFAVEVGDNRTIGDKASPNLGRSSTLRVQIVSDEDYRRYLALERERGLDRVREAAREEKEGSEKVKLLITTQGEKP